MRAALVIGRFQIAGNQHLDLFEQIVEYNNEADEKFDRLFVAVGTSGVIDEKNPFSAQDCQIMIQPIVKLIAKELDVPYEIIILKDINDDDKYANYVADSFGFRLKQDEIFLFSENEWTLSCFEDKKGYVPVVAEERIKMHSTQIRRLWKEGFDIKEYVPGTTLEFLKNHKK